MEKKLNFLSYLAYYFLEWEMLRPVDLDKIKTRIYVQ